MSLKHAVPSFCFFIFCCFFGSVASFVTFHGRSDLQVLQSVSVWCEPCRVFLSLKGQITQNWSLEARVTFSDPHDHSWVSQREGISANGCLLWTRTKTKKKKNLVFCVLPTYFSPGTSVYRWLHRYIYDNNDDNNETASNRQVAKLSLKQKKRSKQTRQPRRSEAKMRSAHWQKVFVL